MNRFPRSNECCCPVRVEAPLPGPLVAGTLVALLALAAGCRSEGSVGLGNADATSSTTLQSGATIHLRAHAGQYVVAEEGGGGAVNANRASAGPWETFTLLCPSGAVQDGAQVQLRTWDGTHFLQAELSPVFDLRMDFNGPRALFAYQAGLEWLVSQTFPIRLGYQFDDIGKHQYLGFGLGWFNEGSGIDLSYRHELGGAEGRLIALTVKLQL